MTDSTNQADELREAIRQTVDDSVLTHSGRSIGDIASSHVADDLLALFDQAQQQLLRELVEQLPEKQYMHQFWEGNTAEPPSRKEANREVTAVRNLTIDQVTALLNKKLQAYGGDSNG
jgi:F0F1-type ATP synthase gamma subunit